MLTVNCMCRAAARFCYAGRCMYTYREPPVLSESGAMTALPVLVVDCLSASCLIYLPASGLQSKNMLAISGAYIPSRYNLHTSGSHTIHYV